MVGIFRISLFIPNGICSNKAQSTRKIRFFLVVWSGLILENIRRMFLLSIWATGTTGTFSKCSRKSDQIEDRAYTTKKSLIFRILCPLFEQILLCINRDILDLTLCGAKNSNNLCAPSGLPTLIYVSVTVLDRLNINMRCKMSLSNSPKLKLIGENYQYWN